MADLKVLNEKTISVTLDGTAQKLALPRFFYQVIFLNTTTGAVDIYIEPDETTVAGSVFETYQAGTYIEIGGNGAHPQQLELANVIFLKGTAGEVLKIRYQNNLNIEV